MDDFNKIEERYSDRGKVFLSKVVASKYAKLNPGSHVYRLISYAYKDIKSGETSGVVKPGAEKITTGWLVHLSWGGF